MFLLMTWEHCVAYLGTTDRDSPSSCDCRANPARPASISGSTDDSVHDPVAYLSFSTRITSCDYDVTPFRASSTRIIFLELAYSRSRAARHNVVPSHGSSEHPQPHACQQPISQLVNLAPIAQVGPYLMGVGSICSICSGMQIKRDLS